MKKICIIVSTPMTVKAFLLKHIEELSKNYEVTVVSSSVLDLPREYKVKIFSKEIQIERKINVISDLKSIWLLYRFLKKEKFNLVLSVTPKAGLITSISAYLASVPNRVHFFTGQVWVTKRGVSKNILKNIDRLIAYLNTNLLADSLSQKTFLVCEKVVSSKKIKVLGEGSISGVNLTLFRRDERLREYLRTKYNIAKDDLVFMFLGRLNTDKGIYDLQKVFKKLLVEYEQIRLFIIGPDEEGIEEKMRDFFQLENVIREGYSSKPYEILNVADVLILPSYREGFGSIVIEAAAMKIPAIGSNIYGLKDAIVDGHTGLLHEKKNLKDMFCKYKFFIENKKLIKQYGIHAYQRVVNKFDDREVSKKLQVYIDTLINNTR